jgi:F-type H+-transporting ATPase subunit alpha
LVEILKQKQYSPYSMDEQVLSIWAATSGYVDDLPVDQVQRFERELLENVSSRHPEIGETIRSTGKLDDETIEKLKSAVKDFKSVFTADIETVETVASEEGVPEPSAAPAAEAGDAGAGPDAAGEQATSGNGESPTDAAGEQAASGDGASPTDAATPADTQQLSGTTGPGE